PFTTVAWSGGTPTATNAGTKTSLSLNKSTKTPDLSFTLPADTTPRVLRVYAAFKGAAANNSLSFTAHPADASFTDYSDSTTIVAPDATTITEGIYTLHYSTSTSTTLTVTLQGSANNSTLYVEAATLTA